MNLGLRAQCLEFAQSALRARPSSKIRSPGTGIQVPPPIRIESRSLPHGPPITPPLISPEFAVVVDSSLLGRSARFGAHHMELRSHKKGQPV